MDRRDAHSENYDLPSPLWWSRTRIKLDLMDEIRDATNEPEILKPPNAASQSHFGSNPPGISWCSSQEIPGKPLNLHGRWSKQRHGESQPNLLPEGMDFEFSLPGSRRNRTEMVIGSGRLLWKLSWLSSPFIPFSWPRMGWEMGGPIPSHTGLS